MFVRVFSAAILVAALAAPANAYEGYVVEDGGTIRGRVRVHGTVPPAATLEVSKDAPVCGHAIDDRSLLAGEDGGLANAIVYLTDIEAGKPVDAKVEFELENRACRFEPHVQALSVGQTLTISNSDPVLHNTRSQVVEGGQGNRFNLALPRQGQRIRKPMKRPGLHHVQCDAGHTWMSAYFLVLEHPYHVVTGVDGSFALDSVPPGEYTLRIWHETLGSREVVVEVSAGASVDVPDVVFEAPSSED